ncbi:MAG: S41 family peptidase [Bacteroidota bacterium]
MNLPSLFLGALLLLTTIAKAQFPLISSEQALEDAQEFQQLLEERSSYLQLSDLNHDSAFQALFSELGKQSEIEVQALSQHLGKILYAIGDRHCKVEFEEFEEDTIVGWERYFPAGLARYEDQLAVLQRSNRAFTWYAPNYPYLKNINGQPWEEFLAQYAPRHQLAPREARISRAAETLRDLGELYVLNGIKDTTVRLQLTNGQKDTSLTLPLIAKRQWYISKADHWWLLQRDLEAGNYAVTARWLEDSIAYLILPDMYDPEDEPAYFQFLENHLTTMQSANGWILDIRGNGGGTRDILQLLAPYLIQPEQSPWIANVAYVRTPEPQTGSPLEGMAGRYLFPLEADEFEPEEQKTIASYLADFSSKKQIPEEKFSEPHVMLLRAGKRPFPGPVYVLMDEFSFSAASVFATAFKGLPNVRLVGVRTDGSSGRSRNEWLTHSNIRVKWSTMASFQRNGLPLDGYGTEPDLQLEPDWEQVFFHRDTQLERAIRHLQAAIPNREK